MKNLMPLPAMSALMRVIASAIGTALLTRTMPSSLSALAAEATEIRQEYQQQRGAEIRNAGLSCDVSCPLAHAGSMASRTG